MTQQEKENILNEFIKKITDDTVDISSEIQEIIDENFFDLL